MVEVIKLSEHLAALKAKGLRTENPTRANDTERARQQAARMETQFRERVFSAIRTKTTPAISGDDLLLIAQALWQFAGHDARVRLAKLWGWADKSTVSEEVHRCDAKLVKLTEIRLRQFVIDAALIGEVRAGAFDTRKPVKLLETARRLQINTEEIRKALKAGQAPKTLARGRGMRASADRGKSS